MFYNYIKTAWRFLSKNRLFTIINIIGLTTGITAFLMIALYLQNELSYDKQLPRKQDTYRLVGIQEPRGLEKQEVAFVSGAWAQYARENIPEVEQVFRLMLGAPSTIEAEEEIFRETLITYSEGDVISYLGFPLIHGTAGQVELSEPNQALISREAALRLFKSEQVTGKTFRNGEHLYTITGVFENQGIKSHWEADIFLSIATVEDDNPYLHHFANNTLATYLVLHPGASPQKVGDMITHHYQALQDQETYANSMPISFYLQQASDIYLRSKHIQYQLVYNAGSLVNVYLFSMVAILILIIACINFINLATANSLKRAKEVGLRKVLGAGQKKLALQFIGESLLITFFSLLISLGLLELMLPGFNMLLDTELTVNFISNPLLNIGLIAILVSVGLISGLYPAIYLSRLQAAQILKSQSDSGKPKAAWLRKTLVIFQFTISTAIIMATLVVMSQVHFMKNKDRGYNPKEVINLPLSNAVSYDQLESFRNYLLTFPEIQNIGIASNYNGVAGQQSDVVVADSVNTRLMVRFGYVSPDFFPTMDIEVIEGRNFSHESGNDIHQAIMINESTARALGWEEPVGKRFRNDNNPDYDYYTVIGVVKDYHFYWLKSQIQPAVYLYYPEGLRVLNIRYQTDQPQLLAKNIEAAFKSFFPNEFFNSQHVDDILGRQTRTEENIMQIFTWFSALSIIISCLGLFGLSTYMVNQRRKEISLRKILGGSIPQINLLLLVSFLKWVVLAAIIALPVTYLTLSDWLENYPYRISIGILHLGIPVVTIILIASATILILTTRAARQNPADNLKYE
ncbi:MAG: ABC transporter permease [Bacteroidales bacterium]